MDEAAGIRDELDTISLRDVSAMRYVRHQEWMDQVIGNNMPTSKLAELSPRIFSSEITNVLTKEWTFSNPQSLKKKLAELQSEIKELEADKEAPKLLSSSTAEDMDKNMFVKDGIAKLRDTFGSDSTDSDEIIKEFETKFGVSVIESERVKRVDVNLELPNYATAPLESVTNTNADQPDEHNDILADSALGDDLLADLVSEDAIMNDS